jgi:hypothetical protein
MSSHLDYWLNIVDNGNSGDDGNFLTRHHLWKWMKDFVEREWLFTTPLLNNKSANEVFLVPFWYVNVKLEVRVPTNLAMLELVTRLRTPSTTREPIECLFKLLDGTPVACGSRIGRGLDVVFRVSFSIAIMSLVFTFKSWKLNNNVFTSFCTTSRVWS